jgi:HD-GYP domain-containing protein (c-di-GMP phosphodiesterase class II)/Tfp pilus assembly protein PilZ
VVDPLSSGRAPFSPETGQRPMNAPQDADNQQLYNSKVLDAYLRLLKNFYPQVNIQEILAHAQIKPYEVADQWYWFTQEQVNAFYEKVVELTGNPQIAREAGRYAMASKSDSVINLYVLGFLGPHKIFELIEKSAKKFTRSAHYKSLRLGRNQVEITVTPNPGVEEKPFQCENRIGFFEGIITLFQDELPEIEHPECLFKGGRCCRYRIAWKPVHISALSSVQNISGALTLLSLALLYLFDYHFYFQSILAVSLPVFLGAYIYAGKKAYSNLKRNMERMRLSADSLLGQVETDYNNALLINDISQSISTETSIDSILESLMVNFQKRLDFDRGAVFLVDHDRTRLVFRKGYGYSEMAEKTLRKTVFQINNPRVKGIFVVSLREKKPFLVNNLQEIEEDLSPRSLALVRSMGVKSLLCCPIIHEDQAIGILAVDNLVSKRPLLKSDLMLVNGIAPLIGIAIRNAQLLEGRKQRFNSTLQVLAATIDARDPLTAGHSEKVTRYAMGICRELNLSDEYCEMIRVAALLHDYGKIAVPDHVLKKPGRLSADEYALVQTHAEHTRRILEGIQFDGIFEQIPAIAGAHHEKIDGSGYPLGLTGDQIPLGAKILAVADFFEAITAKRHYRDPMPLHIAIQVLKEERGVHLAEEVVDAFLRYFYKTCSDEIRKSMDQPEDQAKRAAIRVSCESDIYFEVDGQTFRAAAVDLSTRGLFIASEQPPKENSLLRMSFSLPGVPATRIRVTGRVAWINHGTLPRKKDFPPGFGVAFVDLEESDRQRLLAYVDRNLGRKDIADSSPPKTVRGKGLESTQ